MIGWIMVLLSALFTAISAIGHFKNIQWLYGAALALAIGCGVTVFVMGFITMSPDIVLFK